MVVWKRLCLLVFTLVVTLIFFLPHLAVDSDGEPNSAPRKIKIEFVLPPEITEHIRCLNLSDANGERDQCLLNLSSVMNITLPCNDINSVRLRDVCRNHESLV